MKKFGAILTGIIGIFLLIEGIVSKVKKAVAFSIIGGADGPTSVFLAGNLGADLSIGMIVIGVILVAIMIILLRKNKK